jgi:hypothetical protein
MVVKSSTTDELVSGFAPSVPTDTQGVALPASQATGALGGDGYTNFGSGYSNTHTTPGWGHVTIESETAYNPKFIRGWVDDNGGNATILFSWAAKCFNPGTGQSQTFPPDGGAVQAPTFVYYQVPSWASRCAMSVDAVHQSTSATGHIDAWVDATY